MKYHITIDKTGQAWLTNEDGTHLGYMEYDEIEDLRCSCEFALTDLDHTGEHGVSDWMKKKED